MDTQAAMGVALEQAEAAARVGEVPVGAALFGPDGTLVAADHNRVETFGDPTAHAELLVIQKAVMALETPYLDAYTLYVTLEPCAMCAQAMAWARVGELRFGAYDVKSGGVTNGARIFDQPTCHHRPAVYGGLMEAPCGALLTHFFRQRRGVE